MSSSAQASNAHGLLQGVGAATSRQFDDFLLSRWQDAIERSKKRLGEKDGRLAESLGHPDAAVAELEKMANFSTNSWFQYMKKQITPAIYCLQSFSKMFCIAMLPHSIETSLVWGVLALVLQLAFVSEERSRKITNTLDSIRLVLQKVNRYASSDFQSKEEVKENLVMIYAKLLDLWVNIIRKLRENPPGSMSRNIGHSFLNEIDNMLDSALSDIQERYEDIKDISMSPTNLSNHHISPPDNGAQESLTFPVFVEMIPENPRFQTTGREGTIQRIHEHLNLKKSVPGRRCFTLYGMGGIGKTQVAAFYAYQHCRAEDGSYDAVLWVDSQTSTSIQQSFLKIAQGLKRSGVTANSDPATALAAVKSWLKQTDKRWLLIFDNVERWADIFPKFWPEASTLGAIILTSRDFQLAGGHSSGGEELQAFNAEESMTLATSILGDWDSADPEEVLSFKEILQRLSGLPLAIDQISNLIRENGSSLTDFLVEYDEDAETSHKSRAGDHHPFYNHSLDTALRLAMNKYLQDPDARIVLGVMSLLFPDTIPMKLFQPRPGLRLPAEATPLMNPQTYRHIQKRLRASGVISVSKGNIRIHRLSQSTFWRSLSEDTQNIIFNVTALLLNEAFPKQLHGDPLYDRWDKCSMYILHAQLLGRFWKSQSSSGNGAMPVDASDELLTLLCNAAWYLRELQDFQSAMELVEIGKKACGLRHGIFEAHLLNTEGVVKQHQYDYASSKQALEQSAEIRNLVLGHDHPDTIGIKQNLASIVAAQCQYEKALKLYQEAEALVADKWPSESEKRLASCRFAANFGRCYTEIGQFEDARQNLGKSIALLDSGADNKIYRRAIEFCFGNLELAIGNKQAAKKHFRTCLDNSLYPDDIQSKDRMRTCACYYKLASIEIDLGDKGAALTNLVESMRIAQDLDAQGYIYRILRLKASFAEVNGLSEQDLGESEEKLHLKIDAVQKNLQGMICAEEELKDAKNVFMLFIPWQCR